ncbi:MAG: transporter permease [Chitinophagaceae bacterium]|nr:transporter permease [Chitinophagaceae bacterium]
MLNNYVKTAIRHAWHNKLYSFINVSGLAIAIACVLLAVLFIKDENSFDRFHEKKANLFRVTTTLTGNKEEKKKMVGGTGQVQGPAFKEGVPEIQDYARLLGGDIYGDIAANEKILNLRMLFVDESFFNIFSFDLLKGNRQTALKEINSVVLTESTALKLFNSIDVVGKTIQVDADPSAKRLGKPLIISGVVKDPPNNSSIRFDALFTLKFMQLSFEDNAWLNQYLGTFVLLHPKADIKVVTSKFDEVFAAHAKEQVA